MDERTKKEEDIYLGVYHPHPKEAPKSWRMARMKELRAEVMAKRLEKKRQWGLMEEHAKGWGLLVVYIIAFVVQYCCRCVDIIISNILLLSFFIPFHFKKICQIS